MKFHTVRNYKKENDNLLYFALRCEEMLFHYSIDMVRVPLLNTHQLIKEYIAVYEDKNINDQGRRTHLSTIFEEMYSSFENDIILKKVFKDDLPRFLGMLKTSNETDLLRSLRYFDSLMSQKRYFSWCCKLIKDYAANPKAKDIMEELVCCFLPELIYYGYSAEYIYYIVILKFFVSETDAITTLNSFFDTFNFKKSSYNVYIGISHNVMDLRSCIEKRFNATFEDDGQFSKYRMKNKKNGIVKFNNIESMDRNRAMDSAYYKLSLVLEMKKLLSHSNALKVENKGMVFDVEKETYSFTEIHKKNFNVIREKYDNFPQTVDSILVNIVRNAKDYRSIKKIIELHNSALSINDLRSGFLGLWSILEVACQASSRSSKMDRILEVIMPVIKKDYLKGTMEYLEKLIKDNSAETYKHILEKVAGDSDTQKITKCVFLPEYQELRNDVYSRLELFPVIRNRIYKINQTYADSKKLCCMMEEYSQKVKWNLYRMYRARNSIVHSGEAPENLKSLGEHLHIYVDSIFYEILYRISEKGLMTVENALVDTDIFCKKYFEILNSTSEMDENILDKLAERTLF